MHAGALLGPDDLARTLAAQGVRARVLRLERPTRTVAEAAAALGVDERTIVKSLLFRSAEGQFVLVVVRGDQRVDPVRLAQAMGHAKLVLASPEDVLAVTGYPAGATPPVGHRTALNVVVDPGVLEEPVVYGGGGDERSLLEIAPDDVVRLTGAIVVPVARESQR